MAYNRVQDEVSRLAPRAEELKRCLYFLVSSITEEEMVENDGAQAHLASAADHLHAACESIEKAKK